MRVEPTLAAELASRPDPGANRRLLDALEPGRARLVSAGVASALASAATAAAFFALAAVAQDVLEARASWAHERGWLTALAAAAVVRAASACAAAALSSDGARAVEARLRSRLLARLIARGVIGLTSAAQATALIDEVDHIGAYAERYQPARVAALLVPLVLLAAVFPLNWQVGTLLVLCAPLPPVNLSVVGMGTAAVARRNAEELRHLSGYFLDRLRGLATLRALGAERAELARVSEASGRLVASSMIVLRTAFIAAAALEAIVTVAVAVVAIYIGLTLLGYVNVPGLPSHMSLRTGLFLLLVTPLYFQPVRALAAAYHERADALAAIAAIQPLLEAAWDRSPAWALSSPPAIVVSAVTVAFAHRELSALDDVSFSIERGELIGVAGASGAGKSTLLRVLAGDLDPSAGTVLLDGKPAREVARTDISWLGQRPYLFPGSLEQNITLGSAGFERAQTLQAALAAGLGELLDRLPDGLETPVPDGGWGFSRGEIHRLALARILLRACPLVLLDEPTAHLDAVSEANIIEILRLAAAPATAIVASHSPAVLAACDRVIALDRGRLIAVSVPPAPTVAALR